VYISHAVVESKGGEPLSEAEKQEILQGRRNPPGIASSIETDQIMDKKGYMPDSNRLFQSKRKSLSGGKGAKQIQNSYGSTQQWQ
jgi:hypothetical protein